MVDRWHRHSRRTGSLPSGPTGRVSAADVNYGIFTSDSNDTRHLVLCSQGDRVYPASLAIDTCSIETNSNPTIDALATESNDLLAPKREDMIDAVRLSRATYQFAERGIDVHEQIAHELEHYNDLQEQAHEPDNTSKDDS